MTAISDFCTTIRSWLNYEGYSDELITSWVRIAEEMISERVRCKHMIWIDTAAVTKGRVVLPGDWLDLDFVRIVDGYPLEFMDRTNFYAKPAVADSTYNQGHYTISGNFLMVGGDTSIPGRNVELTYYQNVPPLGNVANWVQTYYPGLLISATLSVANAFGLDDARSTSWATSLQSEINVINENHLKSKASGSRLRMQRQGKKGFG